MATTRAISATSRTPPPSANNNEINLDALFDAVWPLLTRLPADFFSGQDHADHAAILSILYRGGDAWPAECQRLVKAKKYSTQWCSGMFRWLKTQDPSDHDGLRIAASQILQAMAGRFISSGRGCM